MDVPERQSYVRADDLLPGAVGSVVGYDITGGPVGVHRGLPSPWLTFIFSLDAPIETAETPDRLRTPQAARTSIITGGLHTSPAWIHQPAAQSGIQLAVHPLASRALFGVPTAELAATVIDGSALLGDAAEQVRVRLAETPGWTTRFDVLQGYLRRRVAQRPREGVRAEIREAWTWQARHGGRGSIAGMAEHVLLSPRQLHTLFTREVGMGPKGVARLMRFQQALRQITGPVRTDSVLDLARVAADTGYADQSHLTRDFRQFSGLAPTAWLDEERRNIQAGGHRNGDN